MDITFAIFVILAFVAVVLLLEGGFVLVDDTRARR